MTGAFIRKAIRDQRRAVLGWTIGLVAIALMYASFYPSVRDSAGGLEQYLERMPEAMRNIWGGDFTSPAGYLRAELFSLLGPVLLLVFAIGAGARAIAGEEERRTLDLLLSTPLRRRDVLLDKAVVLTGSVAALVAALFVASWALGPVFELTVPAGDLLAACALLGLLGVAFGMLALALGAGTGRRSLAMGITGAAAVFMYILHALAPSVEALRPLHPLSLFRWYLDPDPLVHGLHTMNVAVLVGVAAVALLTAWVTFERRDLAS